MFLYFFTKATDQTNQNDYRLMLDSSLWLTFLAIIILWAVWKVIQLRQRYLLYKGVPSMDGFSFIFGHMHKLPADGRDMYKHLLNDWLCVSHRMFCFWVTPLRPIIFLFHPDAAKVLLQSSESKQVEFGDAFRFVKPWVGEGILLSSGNRWMRARRLLTPAFHFDILKPYIGVYNKTVDSCIETIDKFANSGESFDIYPLLKLCTFDIILKCAMSVDLNVFKKGGNVPYINACDRLLYLWGERIRNIFVYWDAVYRLTKNGQEFYKNCDLVHSFAQEIITKRMQELKEEGPPKKRYLDFLDILLTAKDETGQGLTPLEIRAEVDTFLLAGHETSSTATSWLLHLLSENVDYQKRVQEEVDEVLEGRESKHVLWSDLQKLETLTCCMKEAMRLYPAVPGVGRILTKDTLIDGHTIPAGTRVNVSFILLHRNPDVWEDPHTFRPERFEVEEAKNRNPFAFVPFSAGPRNCIGMTFASNEIRVLVARLLQRYDFAPDPSHPVEVVASSITQSQSGVWMFAKRRK
ncbi:cytochrome P450 4F4-like isoform X2 [Pomacea canaliculata]|uniref:cytochrome P450 4F4-like isoform X2 n=1 Tax=Pomacea canaliculata TaxID=400727 RepID=UPI000D73FF6E|nr:cytochrome P450 4F4-like isoform X2 [Pomacea canaliculata]